MRPGVRSRPRDQSRRRQNVRASARIYPKILLLSAEIQMSSVFVIRQGGNYSGLCLSCFVLKNNGVKPGERKKTENPRCSKKFKTTGLLQLADKKKRSAEGPA